MMKIVESAVSWELILWGCPDRPDRSCAVTSLFHSRKPSTVIIQFWKICWRESIKLLWSTIYNNGFLRILFSIKSLPQAQWSWRRQDRWRTRKKIHHGFWFAVTRSSPESCRNRFAIAVRPNCRPEMANVTQAQQMIPLITLEISFGQNVCELIFGVDVFDLDFGIQINSIKQPIESNSLNPGNMSHCKAPSFNDHLYHCFIVFEHTVKLLDARIRRLMELSQCLSSHRFAFEIFVS